MNTDLGNNFYTIGILLKEESIQDEEKYYEIIDFPFMRPINEGYYKVATGENKGNIYPIINMSKKTNSEYKIYKDAELILSTIFKYDRRITLEDALEFAKNNFIGEYIKYDEEESTICFVLTNINDYELSEENRIVFPNSLLEKYENVLDFNEYKKKHQIRKWCFFL